MKKVMLIAALALLIGCKGPSGDKGDTGIQGARGPGRIEVLSGVVLYNDFTIFDSRITQASQVTVYLTAQGEMIELPYYLPALGYNAYDIITPSLGKIEIVNGLLANAGGFVIVLLLP